MTASTTKFPCTTCGKTCLFTCRGCGKDFCIPDASKHRQTLSQQIDEVTLDHDQLRETIAEYTAEPLHHPLMKQVDEWEKESINKIHQTADHARRQILMNVEKHTIHIMKTLELVKQQLSKAHNDEDFFESDLEQWKKKLDTMKKELAAPSTINVHHEKKATSLISKIIFDVSALTDFFERPTGDIQMEDNGSLILHGQTSTQASVRGRNDYSWGLHRFHFKIEHLGTVKWMFFGIVSKEAPSETESYRTPSSYGWAGHNQVYIDGVDNPGFSEYKTDLEINDTLELLVDCDQQIIHFINERTRRKYRLNVDSVKCSLPWQLNLNLYNNDDRVRILPA
jgi:hypothetical protein